MEITFENTAKKYLKKLRDSKLKNEFKSQIEHLAEMPMEKRIPYERDLLGYYKCSFVYNKCDYRITYQILDNTLNIVKVGTRENYYDNIINIKR